MVDPGPHLGEYPAWGRQRHQVPGNRQEQLVGPPCLHDGPLLAGCRAGHRGVGLAFSQGRDAELASWRSAAMATMAAPSAVLAGMFRGRSSTW
jgi:hypothetical protein